MNCHMPLLQVVPADPMKDDRSLAKLVSDEVKPTKTAAAVEDPTLLALTFPVPPVAPKASADSMNQGWFGETSARIYIYILYILKYYISYIYIYYIFIYYFLYIYIYIVHIIYLIYIYIYCI